MGQACSKLTSKVQDGNNGSDSYNNKTGTYFEFEFIGDQFRLLGAKESGHGIAGISIDGRSRNKKQTCMHLVDNLQVFIMKVLNLKRGNIK